MTIINDFTKAITNGVPVTSVRLRQIEDQVWVVKLTKEGQVALTLGKEVQKAKTESAAELAAQRSAAVRERAEQEARLALRLGLQSPRPTRTGLRGAILRRLGCPRRAA